MQIQITGHHLDITPALRSYIEEKLTRLERHFDHMTAVHVVLTVEKERQKAEATLQANRANLFANAEHDDMYAAVDDMLDKLDRQLKKHKEKLTDHHRGDAARKGPETT
jgi:putative sigma-54 modulation protein